MKPAAPKNVVYMVTTKIHSVLFCLGSNMLNSVCRYILNPISKPDVENFVKLISIKSKLIL